MPYSIRLALHKIAVSLATLWFYHKEDGKFMKFYVRANQLETIDNTILNRRIVVEIRIEDDLP